MDFAEKFSSLLFRWRTGHIEVAVMILFTVVALTIAGLLSAVLGASQIRIDVSSAIRGLLSPAPLLWIVLVLSIGPLPRVDVTGRVALATIATAVAFLNNRRVSRPRAVGAILIAVALAAGQGPRPPWLHTGSR